ncbi:MAG: hypothetical protein K9N21_00395 [Deltaproteobacteria bacterium]|nr:hypothetical protein [Deltaproteobacteria bacterium]
MEKTTLNLWYITHLLLMGVVFCLFVSTTMAADRVHTVNPSETEAVEMATAMGVPDISVTRESPCPGENLFPCPLAKETTKTGSDNALEFRDRYTICSKTVDKGCLITGLTETRK